MKKKMNKIGVSEMLSYVLLIAIAIAVSVGVYAWISTMTNTNPSPDCKDETSLILYEYRCDETGIELTLRNNGRFNINGIILTVTNDSQRNPEYYLMKEGDANIQRAGEFIFMTPLKPGEDVSAKYSNLLAGSKTLNKIELVQIQPFITGKKTKILCKNAIIKESLQNCNLF
jgi:hypothetical protein